MKKSEMNKFLIPILIVVLGLPALIIFGFVDLSAKIDLGQVMEIIIFAVLVVVTTIYAERTSRIAETAGQQADASVRMAEEMREQRRPLVIQEVAPAKGVPYKLADEDVAKNISSEYFKIHNEGNSPAIELEILLLNEEKGRLQIERKTFFSQAGVPIEFYPQGLENQEHHTCYMLCQYRSTFSSGTEKTWYQTWLPFVPFKSQRGDRIIIQPKELEFRVRDKKETFKNSP